MRSRLAEQVLRHLRHTPADLPRLVCVIGPQNGVSALVARRCGYRRYAETLYKGSPVTLFERPAPS